MVRFVGLPPGPPERQVRRQLSEPVIRRWTFDNSRQRLQHEEMEMPTLENRRQRLQNEELEIPDFDNRRQIMIPHVAIEMRNYEDDDRGVEDEEIEMASFSESSNVPPDLVQQTLRQTQPRPIRSIGAFLLFSSRNLEGSDQGHGSMKTYN